MAIQDSDIFACCVPEINDAVVAAAGESSVVRAPRQAAGGAIVGGEIPLPGPGDAVKEGYDARWRSGGQNLAVGRIRQRQCATPINGRREKALAGGDVPAVNAIPRRVFEILRYRQAFAVRGESDAIQITEIAIEIVNDFLFREL